MYPPIIQDFNPHYEYLLLDNVSVLLAACNTIQTDANIIRCVIQVIIFERSITNKVFYFDLPNVFILVHTF